MNDRLGLPLALECGKIHYLPLSDVVAPSDHTPAMTILAGAASV
jgi:hypothetical protein